MRDFMCRIGSTLCTALIIAGAVSINSNHAVAQGLIFDWGGEKTTDSGKQSVRFNGGGKPGDIIVSFGDRKLYHIVAPGIAETYPIAIPREQSRWEGVTSVSMKRENPSWTPTAHMLSENPKLPRWVPGGHPMNPLGNRALYLGSSDYRIHGTDAPWTIGTPASKGCVRMFNKDVADLYPRVKVGAKVTVTWQRFDGKISGATDSPVAEAIMPKNGKENGKATLGALPADNGDDVLRPKARMRNKTSDAGEDADTVVKPVSALVDDEDQPKRKRAKVSDVTDPVKEKDQAEHKGDPEVLTSAAPHQEKRTDVAKASVTSDDDKKDTKTESTERKPRLKSRPKVETGSIAPGSAADQSSPQSIAERALAAAERAAKAAERAAAAAERAVAAQQRSASAPAAVSQSPAVAPAAAPSASTPAVTSGSSISTGDVVAR